MPNIHCLYVGKSVAWKHCIFLKNLSSIWHNIELCDSGGTISYGIPNVSKNIIILCLWMMHKSIITNIGSPNGIKMFLNDANDMYAAFISGNNNCVLKPLILNTAVSVDSEYWSISFFDMGFLKWCQLSFLVTTHPLLLYNVVLMLLRNLLYVAVICVLWIYLPWSEHIVTLHLICICTCMDNKSELRLSNLFYIHIYVLPLHTHGRT